MTQPRFLFTLLLLAFPSLSLANEIAFDLKGKTRERNGHHEFFLNHHDTFSVLLLPGEPRQLCSQHSKAGKEAIENLEGLSMNRYRIKGTCLLDDQGKGSHRITSIHSIMPLGQGVVVDRETTLIGRVEVVGAPKKRRESRDLV